MVVPEVGGPDLVPISGGPTLLSLYIACCAELVSDDEWDSIMKLLTDFDDMKASKEYYPIDWDFFTPVENQHLSQWLFVRSAWLKIEIPSRLDIAGVGMDVDMFSMSTLLHRAHCYADFAARICEWENSQSLHNDVKNQLGVLTNDSI